jgi:diguanylate cyclase (GGDEF)-like protein/PAS domain S-box-containing protein
MATVQDPNHPKAPLAAKVPHHALLKPLKNWVRRGPISALPPGLFLLGLLLTAGLSETVRRLDAAEQRQIDQNLINLVEGAISNKLDIDIALLSSVVGLFQASDDVNRDEFRRFYETIAGSARGLAGIQGVGFARKLDPDQVAPFTAAIRAEGFPNFAVRPEGERPLITTITFLEPFNWRNQRSFGFDMWSDPVRREAMERAARTGQPSLSQKVELLQETGSDLQAGALIYLPIYRDAPTPLPDSNGQGDASLANLVGWAYSPLRMGDLIETAISKVESQELRRSEIRVYDNRSTDPANLLYSNSQDGPASSMAGPGGVQRAFTVAGRTWTVALRRRLPPGKAAGLGHHFWIVLASGLGGSALAALSSQVLVDNQLETRRALAISERAAQERALSSTVFEASSLGIVVTDPEGRILMANNAFTQLSGYRLVEIRGQHTNLLKSGRHDQLFYKEMWDTLLNQGFWEGDLWNRVRSGELRRHHLAISAVRDDAMDPRYFVGMLEDITERHQADEAVRYQARHDILTGLANRSMLMEQLERDLALARRHQQSLALLYIDLDGFKPVNDRYGHAHGDLVLQQVATRMAHVLRDSDLLCRQGGDEFVVLVPQAGSIPELLQLAAKLVATISEPLECLEGEGISASIGLARYPDHGLTADDLLVAADNAMYAAKQQGGCARCATRVGP